MPMTDQIISHCRIVERIRQGSIKGVFLSDRCQIIILTLLPLLLIGRLA